jgi:hypothetical protein
VDPSDAIFALRVNSVVSFSFWCDHDQQMFGTANLVFGKVRSSLVSFVVFSFFSIVPLDVVRWYTSC